MQKGNDNFDKQTDRPWLSVIIPIYNAEKYLKKCLESIIKQSFSNFEMILVDDGSTDTSLDIAKCFAQTDNRIKVFSKPNGGPLLTRIYAAERARGEYILFCDADDYYIKDAFKTLYEEASENACELIQFNFYKKYNHVILRQKTPFSRVKVDETEFKYRDYPKLLCSFYDESRLNTSVWNKLYHNRLLQNFLKLNEIDKIFWGDDLIQNLYLLQDCQTALFIDKPLYVYRALSGGTSRFQKNNMRDLDCIKQYQLSFFEKWDGEDHKRIQNILFSEIASWFFLFVKQCVANLESVEAEEIIKKSIAQPTFVKAREYYQMRPFESWQAVELLRRGDPLAYIEAAQQSNQTKSPKEWIKKIVEKIKNRL